MDKLSDMQQEYQNHLSSKQHEIDELQAELTLKNNTIQQLQQQLTEEQKLNQNYKNWGQKTQEWKDFYNNSIAKQQLLQTELKNSQIQLEQANSKINELTQQLVNQKQDYEKQLQDFKMSLEHQLENDLTHLGHNLNDTLMIELQDSKITSDHLENEVNKYHKQLTELQSDLQILHDELKS